MSNPIIEPHPCSNPITCPDGNCPGCRDKIKYCRDPRCFPYCPGCPMPKHFNSNANLTFAIVAFCLLCLIILAGGLYIGRFFHPRSPSESPSVDSNSSKVGNSSSSSGYSNSSKMGNSSSKNRSSSLSN